ncbi:MAG: hypothetical protein RDV41_10040 [Planctomycetota bacterium]|nr:hypothetical protein [Planctomycetota bacterium]
MGDFDKHEATEQELACTGCGATLKFKPGTASLKCDYCGAMVEIPKPEGAVEELDFNKVVSEQLGKEEKLQIATVKCTSCGASSTMKPNVTSDLCPFCGVALVLKDGSTSTVFKPKSLLPFRIDQKAGLVAFQNWVKKLWFAPSKLKQYAEASDKLAGLYIPYWTYDANTSSSYTGQRGDYYYVTESYTTTEGGKTVRKTRQVRKIRWTFVAGHVSNTFDDVLVLASQSLPRVYADRLEPWDLGSLVPFDEKYLSGFRTESYQIDLKQGFEIARGIMDNHIRQSVRRAIGGDEQRILSLNTRYSDITFKHILLPIWISSYRYNNKVYRFLVNGRTGEVQGERPYSWIKIVLFILMIMAIVAGVALAVSHFQ